MFVFRLLEFRKVLPCNLIGRFSIQIFVHITMIVLLSRKQDLTNEF
jgi:hypothetical protein